MEYVRLLTHVDILVYNSLLKEVQGKTEAIMKLIDNIGELDACISIASFREMLSLWCRPEFVDGHQKKESSRLQEKAHDTWKATGISENRAGEHTWTASRIQMQVEDLYHPLLTEAVANSFQVSRRNPCDWLQRIRQVHLPEKCGNEQHSGPDSWNLHLLFLPGTFFEGDDIHGSSG